MADRGGKGFFGWRVAYAAFVLGFFGWGIGFYGPPVFLDAIRAATGWSVALISAAVTAHFLVGALVGANLPALHRRLGAACATKVGTAAMALGAIGWATAAAPWQLFVASGLTGIGWGSMSAAALNALVSPWFARQRPAALAAAYNGASVGGIVFSPLWVVAIALIGFPLAALAIGVVTAVTVWVLSDRVFARTPASLGLGPDGDIAGAATVSLSSRTARPLPGALLWRDRRFVTLTAGMTCGLFAQIGLTAHLYSLLVPALGTQSAGLAMGLVTVMAITGRTLSARFMPPGADRRLIAAGGYAAQLAGSLVLAAAAGSNVALLVAGVILFGVGFGNATSLPPLIVQVEFVDADVPRAVALMVGVAQACYAFAPALLGVIRTLSPAAAPGEAPAVFLTVALAQALAIAAFQAGRARPA